MGATEDPGATPAGGMGAAAPASDRVRLRRLPARGSYDAAAVQAVLDAAPVAHVGVVTADGPLVVPMAFGTSGDWLYVHGSAANAALRAAVDHEVCVTVTLLDGLVVGRTPFHSSMNYRSVVVRGRGRRVDDPEEKVAALEVVSDHIVATWDTARLPTPAEVRQTLVVAVPLREASAKVRTGDPVDEPDDLAGPHWGGHVPIRTTWEAPVPSADLQAGIATPAAVAALAGRPVSPLRG